MLRIFLAHAKEDEPVVTQIYKQLKAEGYQPWLDKEDLLAGQHWQTEIPKAIKDSQVFIACLSRNSIAKHGYVQKEFRMALNECANKPPGSIYLIPVRIDDCTIPALRQEEYGINLRDYHWVDLSTDDGFERLLKALRQVVLKGYPPSVPTSSSPVAPLPIPPQVPTYLPTSSRSTKIGKRPLLPARKNQVKGTTGSSAKTFLGSVTESFETEASTSSMSEDNAGFEKIVLKPNARVPRLVVQNKNNSKPEEYPLVGEHYIVGRSIKSCDIVVRSPMLSQRHMSLTRDRSKWDRKSWDYPFVVKDLGSTNGIYRKRRRVSELSLRHGDTFYLGPEELLDSVTIRYHNPPPWYVIAFRTAFRYVVVAGVGGLIGMLILWIINR